MTLRSIPILIVAAAALVCGAALAGTSPAIPKSLALRLSDFPAGSKVAGTSHSTGPGGSVFSATFNFKVGDREEEVTDAVWYIPKGAKPPVPGLVVGPTATYRNEVSQVSGFRGEQPVAVGSYGDQRTANWADYTNADGAHRARAALVVLEGRYVWELIVENCGVLSSYGCAFGPTPPKITKAVAVAELRRYALEQKARMKNAR